MTNHSALSVGLNFVHEAVRYQAQLDPSKIALIDSPGRALTYRELVDRANRLAGRLHSLGVGPDYHVPVWMERSPEFLVTMLAVMEAGGTFIPVDISYPQLHVSGILRNLRTDLLIADREVPPEIARPGLTVLRPEHFEAQNDDRLWGGAALHPDNLAYVIYTSGSMGTPKGVAMSHRGLTRLIRWQLSDGWPGLSTLQFARTCFDVTFQEVFSTLCSGGTLHLVPEELRAVPERLLMFLDERRIERLFLPYVALNQLAKASSRFRLVPRALRHVITAGERLIINEAISDFFCALATCRLDNHYGPTEAHLVTSFTLSSDPVTWPSMPPIGTAVGGVTLYNLNQQLEPVEPDALGELYVAGDGIARGYLGAPALTAERFLPDPFSTAPGARMYKTDDIVRISPRGLVDFVGRSDDQIKVRGFRVDPAEVELALTEHPHVRDAAVCLRAVADGLDTLAAGIVTDGTAVSSKELATHVRQRLPEYMVPSRFVFVDALPLTSSGKVDRQLLKKQIEVRTESAGERASGKSLADTVRAIWEHVLGHDEFGPEDDFFEIGGDSLLAVWVVTEISQATGREIELSVLLEDSTLAGLVRTLEGMALQPSEEKLTCKAITLRSGSSHRILFLAPPLGGELLAYRALARSLNSPIRVVGLRWQPPDPQDMLPKLLPEMAAAHLQKVRSIQASGPYLLAGWSFGGVLAYELAQQLMASGETVEFLGLIDANPVLDPTTGCPTSASRLYERLNAALKEIESRIQAGEEAYRVRQLLLDSDLAGMLGDDIPEGATAAHLAKNLQIARACVWAAMHYRPEPYCGAMDLFEAAANLPDIRQALIAELHNLARGPLRIHSIAGDHSSMLRAPLVNTMAEALDSALATTAVAV